MEDTNASYTFRVNDKHIYLKLLAICVFEFLLLLIIVFILWLVTFDDYGNFFLFFGCFASNFFTCSDFFPLEKEIQ